MPTRAILAAFLCISLAASAAEQTVRLKDIARVQGVRDNPLTGYGIVIGLSGSGDTSKSRVTLQTVSNTLSHYGINVGADDLSARNVAVVMVTASLPAFAEPGQKLDVEVSSVGDARSLTGGTLLLTPLQGPDGKLYALAQGPLSVGGYEVTSFDSHEQRNHPTVGRVPDGASVERVPPLGISADGRSLNIVLYQPDFTTAQRVADALNRSVAGVRAEAEHAGKIHVSFEQPPANLTRAIASIESIAVAPDQVTRVVVNERTGTVVAGGDARIGAVTISQGDLKISVQTDYLVSQPDGLLVRPGAGIQTAVVPQTRIGVQEPEGKQVTMPNGTSVTDLIAALRAIHLPTRDVITILQAIKAAGALRAELTIQ
jgi:flagellar P-ring protein precursor FlgI